MKNFICKYAVKIGSCMAALAVMATALTVKETLNKSTVEKANR